MFSKIRDNKWTPAAVAVSVLVPILLLGHSALAENDPVATAATPKLRAQSQIIMGNPSVGLAGLDVASLESLGVAGVGAIEPGDIVPFEVSTAAFAGIARELQIEYAAENLTFLAASADEVCLPLAAETFGVEASMGALVGENRVVCTYYLMEGVPVSLTTALPLLVTAGPEALLSVTTTDAALSETVSWPLEVNVPDVAPEPTPEPTEPDDPDDSTDPAEPCDEEDEFCVTPGEGDSEDGAADSGLDDEDDSDVDSGAAVDTDEGAGSDSGSEEPGEGASGDSSNTKGGASEESKASGSGAEGKGSSDNGGEGAAAADNGSAASDAGSSAVENSGSDTNSANSDSQNKGLDEATSEGNATGAAAESTGASEVSDDETNTAALGLERLGAGITTSEEHLGSTGLSVPNPISSVVFNSAAISTPNGLVRPGERLTFTATVSSASTRPSVGAIETPSVGANETTGSTEALENNPSSCAEPGAAAPDAVAGSLEDQIETGAADENASTESQCLLDEDGQTSATQTPDPMAPLYTANAVVILPNRPTADLRFDESALLAQVFDFEGKSASNLTGDYALADISFGDNLVGAVAYYTNKPLADVYQNGMVATIDVSNVNYGWTQAFLPDATAILVAFPTDQFGTANLEISLDTIGNLDGDNYVSWITGVPGADFGCVSSVMNPDTYFEECVEHGWYSTHEGATLAPAWPANIDVLGVANLAVEVCSFANASGEHCSDTAEIPDDTESVDYRVIATNTGDTALYEISLLNEFADSDYSFIPCWIDPEFADADQPCVIQITYDGKVSIAEYSNGAWQFDEMISNIITDNTTLGIHFATSDFVGGISGLVLPAGNSIELSFTLRRVAPVPQLADTDSADIDVEEAEEQADVAPVVIEFRNTVTAFAQDAPALSLVQDTDSVSDRMLFVLDGGEGGEESSAETGEAEDEEDCEDEECELEEELTAGEEAPEVAETGEAPATPYPVNFVIVDAEDHVLNASVGTPVVAPLPIDSETVWAATEGPGLEGYWAAAAPGLVPGEYKVKVAFAPEATYRLYNQIQFEVEDEGVVSNLVNGELCDVLNSAQVCYGWPIADPIIVIRLYDALEMPEAGTPALEIRTASTLIWLGVIVTLGAAAVALTNRPKSKSLS